MSSRRKKQVLEWRKKGKTDLEIKQAMKNEVLIRSIIKEAEYLMRCGRIHQAISSVNRVLNHLPHYGLDSVEYGEKLDPLNEVSFTPFFWNHLILEDTLEQWPNITCVKYF